MSGEKSAAQLAPHSDTLTFAVFYAANLAAMHLLDMTRSELSPPNLERHGSDIGYALSIPLLPKEHDPKRIWRIGAGPPTAIIEKKLEHVKPDIILCPSNGSLSAETARKFMKDIHAILHYHAKSGVLMLNTTSNRKPIIYERGDIDGNDLVLTLGEKQSCVMRRNENFIQFGDYRFVLKFITQDQDKDQEKDKIRVQPTSYPGLHPSPVLHPTPKIYSKTSWNIWLHNTIPDTSITSGVNIYTGEPVAVKQLEKKTTFLQYTHKRLKYARWFHKNPDKGVLGIIDEWCKHKFPPCKEVDSDNCERIFYSMPLAKKNFHNMLWKNVAVEERLALLYQTLVGLTELHKRKITHGNISPESLLILTEPESIAEDQFRPGKAVISLDMQKKTPSASICVPPEKWKRKEGQNLDKTKLDNTKLDKTKLDIWALAASWMYAFVLPPKDTKINERSYETLKGTIHSQTQKGYIKEPLAELLYRMLAWNPQERPNAADALADEAWKPVKEKPIKEKLSRKRRREEMMKRISDAKRVRVLSPEEDLQGFNPMLERV